MRVQTTNETTEIPVFSETAITSWDDFVGAVDAITQDGIISAACLRGQANKAWGLEPSLLRSLGNLDSQQALDVEKAALFKFKQQAHLHIPPGPDMDEDDSLLRWWGLMQQYGAPTRLLDWTESPYVACYFAVAELRSEDGAVWAFDPQMLLPEPSETIRIPPGTKLYHNNNFINPSAQLNLFSILFRTATSRMVAQQGNFTVCHQILGLHDQIMADHPKGKGKLWKLIIPARYKSKFLSRLRAMNITAGSLFPGADGLGRSIAEFVQLRSGWLQRSQSSEKPATGAT